MIEEIFEKLEEKTGLIGGIVKVFKTDDKTIKEGISVIDWKIKIKIGRDLDFKQNFIKDVLLHEIAHWKVCPKDIINHHILLDIAGCEFCDSEFSSYLVNAFEDLMVNTWNKFKNPPYEGQIEFFKIQISQKTSKFYKFFVILNLYLMVEEKRVKKLFPDFNIHKKENKEIIEDVKTLIRVWQIPMNTDDKIFYIVNPENWKNMFKNFLSKAKKYFDFLIIPLSAFEPTFNQKANKRESIEKYILYKIKRGEIPSFISKFEFLDAYYKIHTPLLMVNLPLKGDFKIPLSRYGKEKFDPKDHSFFEIDTRSIFFDPNSPFKGKINFYIRPFKSGIRVRGGEKKSLPDLLVILDSSGSMTGYSREIIPWGKKYHNAILGIYAVFSFLKRIKIVTYIKYCLIQFSSHTITTGWLNYRDMKIFKQKLFSPERGKTNLSTKIVEKVLEESKNEKFILLITDSEIHNWSSIRDRLIRLLSKNHTFFFQIGNEGKVSQILKNHFNYIKVKNPQDLAGKIIEVSKNVYL